MRATAMEVAATPNVPYADSATIVVPLVSVAFATHSRAALRLVVPMKHVTKSHQVEVSVDVTSVRFAVQVQPVTSRRMTAVASSTPALRIGGTVDQMDTCLDTEDDTATDSVNSTTSSRLRGSDGSRKCLTKSLLPRYQDNIPARQGCDSIEDSAFHTHVDCYYNCGFCDIWTTNKLALNSVYKYKDLFMFKSIKQAASVMSHKECGRGAAVELMKLTGIVGGAFAVGRVVVG